MINAQGNADQKPVALKTVKLALQEQHFIDVRVASQIVRAMVPGGWVSLCFNSILGSKNIKIGICGWYFSLCLSLFLYNYYKIAQSAASRGRLTN